MGKIAGLWGGNAGILLGFVAAGAVLFGGYLYLADAVDLPEDVALSAPEPTPEARPQSEPLASEPAPASSDFSDSSDTATAPEPAPSEQLAALEPTEPEAVPAPAEELSENAAPAEPVAPEVDLPAPRFDLVRVEQDGSTLIAGKAAPDTEVVIVMDGKEFGRATADGSGAFVSFLSHP